MKEKTLPCIAYFCMEYGLSSDFNQYAGGLGILAGDYLKGAYDMDRPIVGIGILWKQGYTDQRIDADGKPYDSYHNRTYPFLEDTSVEVSVTIRKREVFIKVWKVSCFGNANLYLLDTDLAKNDDAWISGQLYGWFAEERVAQEMVLGIGGVRALRALKIPTDVYHFNEGHAVFAAFELVKEQMDQGKTFNEAVKLTRSQTVFTTHTPIIQGNESHTLHRLKYMGAGNGLSKAQLAAIGGSPFNMTVAALRLSRKANAVAALHAKTADAMWAHVDGRCEIIGITNAIHIPTWVSQSILDAAQDADRLWQAHMAEKRALLKLIKNRNGVTLDENILTIGFSRRAAPYKRSDFIFSDRARIEKLFRDNRLQIVFSGKAHPLDDTGKAIVANLVAFSKAYPKNVVFLENYDMTIGAALTRGADVWLNNPRRPQEASGTSGMKAAMNGVLNCSILDGWWPECCRHGINGWQFGDGFESEDDAVLDAHDLKALYACLENEVLPTYEKDKGRWVTMMQASIADTKFQFSVPRMLEEYYDKLYRDE